MFSNVYAKKGYESRLLSRTTEDAVTVTSPLIPWNTLSLIHIFKWLPEIVIVPLMAFLALTLTYFTTQYKAENLEKQAADSERFAAVMHDLRNKYAGFLADIKAELYTKEQISKKRTELEHIENIVYSGPVSYTHLLGLRQLQFLQLSYLAAVLHP